MDPTKRFEQLLECLIQVVARAAIPEARVREIVETGKKQRLAYNLSDGTRTLSEVARKAKVDSGNFSRAVGRWVEHGVAFWVGSGVEARLLHVYPLAPEKKGKATTRKPRRRSRR